VGAYIVRRILHALLVVVGVSIVIFAISRLSGDPVSLMVPFDVPQEQRQAIRTELGLDRPLPVQYVDFLAHAVRGDFGMSVRNRVPALRLVVERVPATLQLTAVALVFAVLVAIPLGMLSALKHNSGWDVVGMTITFLGQSVPSFWLGILLILVLGVNLRWLPISGSGTPLHLIMPAITLGSFFMASLARLTRSSLLEVLGQDYVRTARAKGLADVVVIGLHALKNAAIPVVTAMGVYIGQLLGGAVITEQIFAYPGVGRLAIDAISTRDFPVVQANVIFVSVVVVALSLLIDMLYLALDPRIRYT
jgi:peptide/nickel transport system permease protein